MESNLTTIIKRSLLLFLLSLMLFCQAWAGLPKAVVIFDQEEVKNSADWFGLWHLKKPLENLGYSYDQSSYQELPVSNDFDLLICYFQDETISDFDKLYRIFSTARLHGKKIVIFGNCGCLISKEALLYNTYNRILNQVGIEDRSNWTNQVGSAAVTAKMEYFQQNISESHVKSAVTYFRSLFPISENSRAIVKVELGGSIFTPVVITPSGGIALQPYLVMTIDGKSKVVLDIEKFIRDIVSQNKLSGNHGTVSRINRKALVLFTSANQTYRDNIFRNHLQLPLNRLGYDFDYLDFAKPFDLKDNVPYDLIVTAFNDATLDDNKKILYYLLKSKASRYIFLGFLPIFDLKGESEYYSIAMNIYRKLGVEYTDTYNIKEVQDIKGHQNYYPFEIELKENPETRLIALQPRTKEYTPILSFTKNGNEYFSALYNENALFIAGDLIVDNKNRKYPVNLFKVTEDFLKPEIIPMFQLGMGYRLMFSHVDGDGFQNTSGETPDILASERCYRLWSDFNYPFSVSFIVNEISPDFNGRPFTLAMAEKIVQLPNVELASHTIHHPFKWDPKPGEEEEFVNDSGYSQGKFDYKEEIRDSLSILSELLGKESNLFFWSGDCQPGEEQLRFCRENRIQQINGGDTVFDETRKSYVDVSPPYTKVGVEVQPHSGAANENLFTNLWQGPFDGFKRVIHTFEKTADPYLVSPIDVYFHFYGGAKAVSYDALKYIFNWLDTQTVSPVFTSEYLKILNDWLTAGLFVTENRFIIRNDGSLRCVKIRKQEKWADISFDDSVNILGFKAFEDCWYVYLNEETYHEIAMSGTKTSQGKHFYFLQSTHRPSTVISLPDKKLYRFRGFGKLHVELAGFDSSRKYQATFYTREKAVHKVELVNCSEQKFESVLRGEMFLEILAL